MTAEQLSWYPSKVDWWLIPLLAAPPVSAIVVCVVSALAGETSALLVGLATAVFVGILYLGVVFPVRYGLDDHYLVVRFGLCRQRFPLAEITEVHRTSNPLSAPALSLDRLHVQFGPGRFEAAMISPAERNLFLDELAQKAGMKRDGDRLVRG
jgi:hypothetical protein